MPSVVIPNWNGHPHLANLLADLRAQTTPPAEILIVDNGSTDGSQALATIRIPTNRGFAHAVNRGIEAARHPWVAILNNDVRLPPTWLETMLDAATQNPGAMFATGKLLRASDPSQLDGSFDLICRGACSWRAGHARPDSPVWSQPRTIYSAPFTATIFRRDLFSQIGLLDEEFESYLEDVDFGLRCALAGHHGIYVPQATAQHIGSATLGTWNPATIRRISRNQLLLIAKHYPPDWRRRYGWPILTAQLLWGAIAARHGTGRAWLEGKREGWARLRDAPGHANPRLDAVLRESEQEIRRLQSVTGYDIFWRCYFALAG